MPRVSDLSSEVAECVERATSYSLTEPDWGINIRLRDIIKEDPGQTKHALEVLKRRLENKRPNVQLLALNVVDCLSENCGESVAKGIVAQNILQEMVKIVKKKGPDEGVRKKILDMIYAWQGAFGGEYHAEYKKLSTAGFEFPHSVENNAMLYAAPQPHPMAYVKRKQIGFRSTQIDLNPNLIRHEYELERRITTPRAAGSTAHLVSPPKITRQFSLSPPRRSTKPAEKKGSEEERRRRFPREPSLSPPRRCRGN